MAKKLNPLNELPTSKSDLTKNYMKEYLKAHGTEEDKRWFVNLVKKTPKVQRECKFDGTVRNIDNLKVLRAEFVNRFFPQLKKTDGGKSYEDELEEEFGLK